MRVRPTFSTAVACSSLCIIIPCTLAEEFVGAEAVLRELRSMAKGEWQETTGSDPETDTFAKNIDEFVERVTVLTPRDAANAWLELVGALAELRESRDESDEPHGLSELVAVLPGPEAWPALREAIDARPAVEDDEVLREQLLKMLAHVLVGDLDAQRHDLEAIEQSLTNMDKTDYGWEAAYSAQALATALVKVSSDPELSVSLLQSRIESLQESTNDYDDEELEVPDLITIAGPLRAEELLRQALTCRVPLEISVGVETKKLARKLAVEMIDELAVPQWRLCDTIEAVVLYEALEGRFAESRRRGLGDEATKEKPGGLANLLSRLTGIGEAMAEDVSDEEQSAKIHYFLGLIASGRTDEAADFLPQVVDGDGLHTYWLDSAMNQMRNAGLAEEVYQLFSELLSRNPQVDIWETYISLAAETDHGDEMVVKIQAAANDPNLRPKQLRALQRHLRDARLAIDQIDAGVALIRKELEACDGLAGDEVDECLSTALRLAELGRLLDHAEWIEEGLGFAQQSFEAADPDSYEAANSASELIKLLTTLKRGPEAEQLAKFRLAKTLRSSGSSTWGDWGVGQFYQRDDQLSALSRLVHVYAEAERHADVVALLDEAPWWGANDLAHIEWLVYMESNATLLLDAAEALAKTGKTDQARHIVRKILGESSGDDRAHELLVELEGQRAISFLDQLAARDRFEERPLIWKAKLLLDDGKVDQAEQVIKQAIAMDPSDGEQGKGDRMRAYAVLADIHQARGDKQQEEFFRRIVRAIRLAEEADDFYAAGLKMRGIAMYREALLQFADAYCIQSRIAIQLAEVGKLDEAADHYQRAYELMPDSFGRVESHCFGCEAAFTGDLAQSTAERVFARIAEDQPKKPQIHYLIGYLRNSQQRHIDALSAYRRAVELDPDYLNAWNQILDLRDKIFLTRELQDEATFNVLRLDPLGKHVSAPTGEVADLAELWRIFSKHRLEHLVVPESLYPLKASREQLEEVERLANTTGSPGHDPWGEDFAEMRSWRKESNAPVTAGDLLSGHRVVSAICTLFDELPGSE